MIRCGQMLFFEVLNQINKFSSKNFHESLRKHLVYFNDNLSGPAAPFSIQNIVPEAFEAYDIKPGDWFRSTSIMLCLDRLNKKYQPEFASSV